MKLTILKIENISSVITLGNSTSDRCHCKAIKLTTEKSLASYHLSDELIGFKQWYQGSTIKTMAGIKGNSQCNLGMYLKVAYMFTTLYSSPPI